MIPDLLRSLLGLPNLVTREQAAEIVLAEYARLGGQGDTFVRVGQSLFFRCTVWVFYAKPSLYAVVDRRTGAIVRWWPRRWWVRTPGAEGRR